MRLTFILKISILKKRLYYENSLIFNIKVAKRAGEMAEMLKVFVTKPDQFLGFTR